MHWNHKTLKQVSAPPILSFSSLSVTCFIIFAARIVLCNKPRTLYSFHAMYVFVLTKIVTIVTLLNIATI